VAAPADRDPPEWDDLYTYSRFQNILDESDSLLLDIDWLSNAEKMARKPDATLRSEGRRQQQDHTEQEAPAGHAPTDNPPAPLPPEIPEPPVASPPHLQNPIESPIPGAPTPRHIHFAPPSSVKAPIKELPPEVITQRGRHVRRQPNFRMDSPLHPPS
jgi:hypothetical protein